MYGRGPSGDVPPSRRAGLEPPGAKFRRAVRMSAAGRANGFFVLRGLRFCGVNVIFVKKEVLMAENGKTMRGNLPHQEGDERCLLPFGRSGHYDAYRRQEHDIGVSDDDRRLYGDHHDGGRGDRFDRHAELPRASEHDRLFQPRFDHPDREVLVECGGLPAGLFEIVRQRDPDRPVDIASGLHAFRQGCVSARLRCWRSSSRTWTRSASCSS